MPSVTASSQTNDSAAPSVSNIEASQTNTTMSTNLSSSSSSNANFENLTMLDFPKPTKQHILNCSYSNWHKKYKTVTPKTRIVPLPSEFVEYLREDGIFLPLDENDKKKDVDDSWSDDEDEPMPDPTAKILPTHTIIKSTIAELGGKVIPKLNWSAPKDANFLLNNSLQCYTPSDIYLLLKSSDFVTHDLEHAFDDTLVDDSGLKKEDIQFDLVLRKWVDVITSVEFRCFVKDRKLVAVTQRDMNYYEFLSEQSEELLELIEDFFEENLQHTFPDSNFTFDVYIPKSRTSPSKVWLIDINPYAPRTDPLIFSWTEILNIDTNKPNLVPEMRLVKKDDPEAYNFNTSKYSAYKLPKEVFDAGQGGVNSLSEFATQWKDIVQKLESKGRETASEEDEDEDDDDDDDDEEEEDTESDEEDDSDEDDENEEREQKGRMKDDLEVDATKTAAAPAA